MVRVHHKIHHHFAVFAIKMSQGVGAYDRSFFRRCVAERRQRDLRLPRAGNQQFEVGAFVVLREVAEVAAPSFCRSTIRVRVLWRVSRKRKMK